MMQCRSHIIRSSYLTNSSSLWPLSTRRRWYSSITPGCSSSHGTMRRVRFALPCATPSISRWITSTSNPNPSLDVALEEAKIRPSSLDDDATAEALISSVGHAVERLVEDSSHGVGPKMLLSDVYPRLPSELRREMRAHKLSLSVCLGKFVAAAGSPSTLSLSDDGLAVVVAGPRRQQQSPSGPKVVLQRQQSSVAATKNSPQPPSGQSATNSSKQDTLTIPPPPVRSTTPLDSSRCPSSQDFFCFHVKLTKIPAPPQPVASVEDVMKGSSDVLSGENVFSVASFVTTIPTYFVPVRKVLEKLPGYTPEHIAQYLGRCKTVQIVSIDDEQFIRIHGGYAQLELSGTEEAEALFPEYLPRLEAAKPFIDAFEDVRERWMPLAVLLQRAGREAELALPYQGKQALLYFAQLQHIFGFAPDDGGAVMLRRPFYSGLDSISSPTPKASVNALTILPLHGQVDFQVFLEQLSDSAKLDISRVFPSVEHFLRSHGDLFYLTDDGLVVMRARAKKLVDTKSLSLAEQLEVALSQRNKKRVRSIRRQIMKQENADHPLLNRDNLAREVFNYIPKKGHVPVKQLFKRILPLELLNFMPKNYSKIFKSYPQYFQIYEFGTSTNWCVSRAGQPLPQGAIRKEFSEDDCVSIFAELLQSRGPKSASFLSLHLPEGVREYIKKRHGSLSAFAIRHKEYFSVVNTIDSGNKEGACVITLIQMPLRREDGPKNPSADLDDDDDDDDEDGDDDEED